MNKIELPSMDFPRAQVSSINCFLDEELLNKWQQNADQKAFLPKVRDTFGKIIFPKGKDYPYCFASIALSMDGKMAYPDNQDGDMLVHSNSLNKDGALADFFILNFLRAYSDAVLVGTKTMKAEANAFVTIHDMELVAERKIQMPDKTEQPFTIVSSKDGTDIPYEHILFHQDLIPVVVFTSPVGFENIQKTGAAGFYLLSDVTKTNIYKNIGKTAIVVTGKGDEPDIKSFLSKMKLGGVDHILIESPTVMWLLMKERLMNEFLITYTSIFVGGQFSPGFFSAFTFDEHPESRIVSLNHHQNTFLFSRQLIEEEK
ncbi:MAG: dihydrofolate reductase family protein [Clostridia bacterium]